MVRKSFIIIAALLFVFLVSFEAIFDQEIEQWFHQPPASIEVIEGELFTRGHIDQTNDKTEVEQTQSLIGMTGSEVIKKLGEPVRKDQSAYGYDWWIYEQTDDAYIQIGVNNDEVVTAFFAGKLTDAPFFSGQTYEQLNEMLSFQDRVNVKVDKGMYQFELSAEDLLMRPLVNYNNDWVQLYFDAFTGELSSVRMMTDDVLLLQRPYSISYRGKLPEIPELSAAEWSIIEEGYAKQIFNYTNFLRKRHGLNPLNWEENVANVAYLHSKEMAIKNYFSHTSPTAGELGDRFEKGDVKFKLAGENIAAKYVDGLASVEGWLNSEGHRVNLLHDTFTHLGVGVYKDYYTQNFMIPWQFAIKSDSFK
ncbi:CAP domain-containing protein [bacterium LRH843]|nr:CAP domain-containing protein [bacterium LRH843]